MDKAYTYDIVKIRKQIDQLLPRYEFDDLSLKFNEVNDLFRTRIIQYDEEILIINDRSMNNEIKIVDVIGIVDEMQLQYSSCLKEKDKFEIFSKIENKSDRFDLIRMDELKSNKSDVNSISLTID